MPYRGSILSCCDDMGICCDVLLCAPCNIGRMWNAKDGTPETPNCLICLCSSILPIAAVYFNCQIRVALSQKYALEEGTCGSLLATLCCGVCALSQQVREFQAQGCNPGQVCCTASQKMN